MENRVYYGEYTLEHWIKLILRGNIKLPKYQRSFCWDINDVKMLIESLENKRFVPPVTIGAFKVDDNNENYIIDGQQRLTSILLSYLRVFPNKNKWSIIDNEDEQEQEELDDETNSIQEDGIDLRHVKWTFQNLIDKGNTKEKILHNFEQSNYEVMDINVADDFFQKTFMGFSYIVPHTENDTQQQEFYSSVFRDINRQGESLTPLETRRSFYFLDTNFTAFFEPTCIESLKDNGREIDFIRYISLLSDNRSNKAQGYSGKTKTKKTLEDYYLKYIYHIIGKEEVAFFKKYSDIFESDDIKNERFHILKTAIDDFLRSRDFSTFIECDIYMFGLINKTIFEGKKIDSNRYQELRSELDTKRDNLRASYDRIARGTSLNYINECLNSSIEIYNKYEAQQPQ